MNFDRPASSSSSRASHSRTGSRGNPSSRPTSAIRNAVNTAGAGSIPTFSAQAATDPNAFAFLESRALQGRKSTDPLANNSQPTPTLSSLTQTTAANYDAKEQVVKDYITALASEQTHHSSRIAAAARSSRPSSAVQRPTSAHSSSLSRPVSSRASLADLEAYNASSTELARQQMESDVWKGNLTKRRVSGGFVDKVRSISPYAQLSATLTHSNSGRRSPSKTSRSPSPPGADTEDYFLPKDAAPYAVPNKLTAAAAKRAAEIQDKFNRMSQPKYEAPKLISHHLNADRSGPLPVGSRSHSSVSSLNSFPSSASSKSDLNGAAAASLATSAKFRRPVTASAAPLSSAGQFAQQGSQVLPISSSSRPSSSPLYSLHSKGSTSVLGGDSNASSFEVLPSFQFESSLPHSLVSSSARSQTVLPLRPVQNMTSDEKQMHITMLEAALQQLFVEEAKEIEQRQLLEQEALANPLNEELLDQFHQQQAELDQQRQGGANAIVDDSKNASVIAEEYVVDSEADAWRSVVQHNFFDEPLEPSSAFDNEDDGAFPRGASAPAAVLMAPSLEDVDIFVRLPVPLPAKEGEELMRGKLIIESSDRPLTASLMEQRVASASPPSPFSSTSLSSRARTADSRRFISTAGSNRQFGSTLGSISDVVAADDEEDFEEAKARSNIPAGEASRYFASDRTHALMRDSTNLELRKWKSGWWGSWTMAHLPPKFDPSPNNFVPGFMHKTLPPPASLDVLAKQKAMFAPLPLWATVFGRKEAHAQWVKEVWNMIGVNERVYIGPVNSIRPISTTSFNSTATSLDALLNPLPNLVPSDSPSATFLRALMFQSWNKLPLSILEFGEKAAAARVSQFEQQSTQNATSDMARFHSSRILRLRVLINPLVKELAQFLSSHQYFKDKTLCQALIYGVCETSAESFDDAAAVVNEIHSPSDAPLSPTSSAKQRSRMHHRSVFARGYIDHITPAGMPRNGLPPHLQPPKRPPPYCIMDFDLFSSFLLTLLVLSTSVTENEQRELIGLAPLPEAVPPPPSKTPAKPPTPKPVAPVLTVPPQPAELTPSPLNPILDSVPEGSVHASRRSSMNSLPTGPAAAVQESIASNPIESPVQEEETKEESDPDELDPKTVASLHTEALSISLQKITLMLKTLLLDMAPMLRTSVQQALANRGESHRASDPNKDALVPYTYSAVLTAGAPPTRMSLEVGMHHTPRTYISALTKHSTPLSRKGFTHAHAQIVRTLSPVSSLKNLMLSSEAAEYARGEENESSQNLHHSQGMVAAKKSRAYAQNSQQRWENMRALQSQIKLLRHAAHDERLRNLPPSEVAQQPNRAPTIQPNPSGRDVLYEQTDIDNHVLELTTAPIAKQRVSLSNIKSKPTSPEILHSPMPPLSPTAGNVHLLYGSSLPSVTLAPPSPIFVSPIKAVPGLPPERRGPLAPDMDGIFREGEQVAVDAYQLVAARDQQQPPATVSVKTPIQNERVLLYTNSGSKKHRASVSPTRPNVIQRSSAPAANSMGAPVIHSNLPLKPNASPNKNPATSKRPISAMVKPSTFSPAASIKALAKAHSASNLVPNPAPSTPPIPATPAFDGKFPNNARFLTPGTSESFKPRGNHKNEPQSPPKPRRQRWTDFYVAPTARDLAKSNDTSRVSTSRTLLLQQAGTTEAEAVAKKKRDYEGFDRDFLERVNTITAERFKERREALAKIAHANALLKAERERIERERSEQELPIHERLHHSPLTKAERVPGERYKNVYGTEDKRLSQNSPWSAQTPDMDGNPDFIMPPNLRLDVEPGNDHEAAIVTISGEGPISPQAIKSPTNGKKLLSPSKSMSALDKKKASKKSSMKELNSANDDVAVSEEASSDDHPRKHSVSFAPTPAGVKRKMIMQNVEEAYAHTSAEDYTSSPKKSSSVKSPVNRTRRSANSSPNRSTTTSATTTPKNRSPDRSRSSSPSRRELQHSSQQAAAAPTSQSRFVSQPGDGQEEAAAEGQVSSNSNPEKNGKKHGAKADRKKRKVKKNARKAEKLAQLHALEQEEAAELEAEELLAAEEEAEAAAGAVVNGVALAAPKSIIVNDPSDGEDTARSAGIGAGGETKGVWVEDIPGESAEEKEIRKALFASETYFQVVRPVDRDPLKRTKHQLEVSGAALSNSSSKQSSARSSGRPRAASGASGAADSISARRAELARRRAELEAESSGEDDSEDDDDDGLGDSSAAPSSSENTPLPSARTQIKQSELFREQEAERKRQEEEEARLARAASLAAALPSASKWALEPVAVAVAPQEPSKEPSPRFTADSLDAMVLPEDEMETEDPLAVAAAAAEAAVEEVHNKVLEVKAALEEYADWDESIEAEDLREQLAALQAEEARATEVAIEAAMQEQEAYMEKQRLLALQEAANRPAVPDLSPEQVTAAVVKQELDAAWFREQLNRSYTPRFNKGKSKSDRMRVIDTASLNPADRSLRVMLKAPLSDTLAELLHPVAAPLVPVEIARGTAVLDQIHPLPAPMVAESAISAVTSKVGIKGAAAFFGKKASVSYV